MDRKEIQEKLLSFNFSYKSIKEKEFTLLYNGLELQEFQYFSDKTVRFIKQNPDVSIITKSKCIVLVNHFNERHVPDLFGSYRKALKHPDTEYTMKKDPNAYYLGPDEAIFLEEHKIALNNIINVLPDEKPKLDKIHVDLTLNQLVFLFNKLHKSKHNIFGKQKPAHIQKVISQSFTTKGSNELNLDNLRKSWTAIDNNKDIDSKNYWIDTFNELASSTIKSK